jgi:hypothetical protein
MAHLSKAIDGVRAKEAKSLEAAGYEPVLEGMRFCLLERPENLSGSQEIKLGELLRHNLRTVRAYLASGPSEPSKSPSITNSATYPNPNLPTDSAEEPLDQPTPGLV